MTRAREVEGTPKEHLDSPAHWPYGDLVNDHPAARYARAFSRALASAVGPDSYRSVARKSGVSHGTISALVKGNTWPDLITISKLEWALGQVLWPGPLLFAEQLRGLRAVQAEYLRMLARRQARLPAGVLKPGEPGTACVRINSGRARTRVSDLLGRDLDEFVIVRDRFPWPHFYVIPEDRLDDVLRIPSVQPLTTVPVGYMRAWEN